MTLHGRVLTVDEPKLLVYTWGDDLLRFELHPDGAGTNLILINELPPETAARNAAGWDQCLDRLAGRQPDPGGWRVQFEHYAAEFLSALGPQDGPPPEHKGAE